MFKVWAFLGSGWVFIMGVRNSSSVLDFICKQFLFCVLTSVHLMDKSGISRSQLKPQLGEPVKIFDRNLFKWKDWHFLINKWKLAWIQFDICHFLQNYEYSLFSETIFKQNAFGRWQILNSFEEGFSKNRQCVSKWKSGLLRTFWETFATLVCSRATIQTIFQLREVDLKKLLNSLWTSLREPPFPPSTSGQRWSCACQ